MRKDNRVSKRSERRAADLKSADMQTALEIYREIVENVKTGILVAQDARLVFVNRGIAQFLGYAQDELLNHPNPFEFIHPDDMQMVAERHMRRLNGEDVPGVYPYRVITKDGQIKWVEVTGVQIVWEGKPATLNFFIDITEQKKAQLALEQSEKRYRSLVENTMDGYFIYEPMSGQFLFLNQRICDLFGYSMQEAMKISIWDAIAPEEHDIASNRIKVLMENPDAGLDTRIYNVTRKDGSAFKAEVATSLVTYEGRPAVQGTLRDITEKKALQDQLLQAQRLESIGTLAGGLAHDFNNLLMGIQGRISLMMMNTETNHPDYEQLKDVGQYVRRAVGLTKQLLDFARGGKNEVKPLVLNHLISESADLFGQSKKQIHIHKDFEKALWTVEADRCQIEQVLLNLYVNAWHAMPGGGELYLKTENFMIDEHFVKPYQAVPGKYVKISVTDTGSGIDKAIQEKIFDPFFTTKKMGRGTGLGLASAYGIIKNHAGFINVYSESGQGTTFTIYLPASEVAVFDTPESVPELTRGNETIMLVDDEDYILKVGRRMLSELGYTVFTAPSGADALDIYRQYVDSIHMVILDMVMPGMNGVQTFDCLRAVNPELKVLLSSGYSPNTAISNVLNRGCDGFIQKPFDVLQLSQKVREILG